MIGSENDTLTMIYGADGRLLQRKYKQNNTELLKRDYLSNKEYESSILKNINHACGRITKNGSTFSYEYHLTDHLGNVRTVFSDSNNDSYISATEVMQRNDYYAFGLELQGSQFNIPQPVNSNRFKYNGKEEVSQMNLGLLDYGARNLDKALGRWLGVDPLADHPNQVDKSPYAYAWNNPVKMIDPDGQLPIIPIIMGIWAVGELAVSAYDAYSTAKTLADPKATTKEKLASGGGFIIGLFTPGGGYGTAAKQGVKMIDNVAKEAVEISIKVGGKQVDNIDDFYKATAKLDVNERVATYKQAAGDLAKKNEWTKNAALSKKNGRDIYSDKNGTHYSVDTQHGRFEVLDKKGKHQREIDFSGKETKGADKSGKHNITF
jgi:RHS repeat-associated protein